MIKIISAKTESEAGITAANIIAEVIKEKPDAVIGLATGSSPLGTYSELIKMQERGEISFKNVKSINLDEYVSLPPDHEQSYAYFMRHNLFDHIDIERENTHLPCGVADNLAVECERYDRLIASLGGVDIQLLGIGHNGHIAFNEPDDSFTKGTGLVSLSESTIDANSRFFESADQVPSWALSMGIGSIMQSGQIILLAFGSGKAEILERALFGPVTPAVPASILQFFKGNVTVCADEEALSIIKEKHQIC